MKTDVQRTARAASRRIGTTRTSEQPLPFLSVMSLDRSDLENISVILVRPIQGGNVGAVARAMRNMGFSCLKLVQPEATINLECRKMAGRAIHVVEQAAVFGTFDEAASGEQVLVGTTSGRGRKGDRRVYSPREIAPRISRFATRHRVGVVFGSERSGLSSEEMAKCQYCVSVPGSPDSPVLNLSQAVLLLLYEIRCSASPAEDGQRDMATQAEREALYSHMEEVLIRIGFLSTRSPAPVMKAIRGLLSRTDLDPREVSILRGVMSQMDWYVKEGYKLGPEKVRKP